MLNSVIIDPTSLDPVYIDEFFSSDEKLTDGQKVLATTDPLKFFGRFKTFLFTSATTNEILVEPLSGGSLFITDLVVFARQQTGREIQVNLTDGTNTEFLFDANLNNEPIHFGITFGGRWRGWRDARIEVTSDSTQRYSIGIGYVKTKTGEEYATWDARR